MNENKSCFVNGIIKQYSSMNFLDRATAGVGSEQRHTGDFSFGKGNPYRQEMPWGQTIVRGSRCLLEPNGQPKT